MTSDSICASYSDSNSDSNSGSNSDSNNDSNNIRTSPVNGQSKSSTSSKSKHRSIGSEDTEYDEAKIQKLFGKTISKIVVGLTKISKLKNNVGEWGLKEFNSLIKKRFNENKTSTIILNFIFSEIRLDKL